MKKVLFLGVFGTFAMAGFFGNEADKQAAKEQQEKQNLCHFYAQKLDEYAKIKNEDPLANATYHSYQQRIAKFCPHNLQS